MGAVCLRWLTTGKDNHLYNKPKSSCSYKSESSSFSCRRCFVLDSTPGFLFRRYGRAVVKNSCPHDAIETRYNTRWGKRNPGRDAKHTSERRRQIHTTLIHTEEEEKKKISLLKTTRRGNYCHWKVYNTIRFRRVPRAVRERKDKSNIRAGRAGKGYA